MDEIEIVVLSVPDCPNAAVALSRSLEAAAQAEGATVRSRVVESEDDARTLGMHGSPTITIDGVDRFGEPDEVPQLACRIRPGEDPVPSAEEILRAVREIGSE